jgi:hypothetical protein
MYFPGAAREAQSDLLAPENVPRTTESKVLYGAAQGIFPVMCVLVSAVLQGVQYCVRADLRGVNDGEYRWRYRF